MISSTRKYIIIVVIRVMEHTVVISTQHKLINQRKMLKSSP